jgi:hypothetical protein
MAFDIFHATVRNALLADGWTITHDPLIIAFGDTRLFVDFGAERLLAAEKEGRKIAVEVKSFISRSPVHDLENALGQYMLYQSVLQRREADRFLYLAVPISAAEGVLNSELGRVTLEDYRLRLLVFDPDKEQIAKWIEPTIIDKL